MKKNYDVIVVGAGPAGIMTCYELYLKAPDKSVLLIDKGHDVMYRHCPIKDKKIKSCPVIKENEAGCLPACSITSGFGGAGAYSDGKFNITSEFGGWLTDYLDNQEVEEIIHYVDDLYLKHGATHNITDPTTDKVKEIEKRGYAVGLKLLRAKVRHLGTEENLRIMTEMSNKLKEHIDMVFKTTVHDIYVEKNRVKGIILENGEKVSAQYVVLTPGRDGSTWLTKVFKNQGLNLYNNQVDIGVRVELPSMVWEHFSKKIYEPKIWYRSKRYGDTTRMFCFNERGSVVTENTDGVLTVNGHSYRDLERKTENSNFALLSTIRFTEPFKNPIEYARYVASLANLISGGSVLVQRLGDLERGRRSDAKRIAQSTTRPTMNAVAGDLSLCIPKRQLDNIIETLHALDAIAPGTANFDTLLYGIECKYYSARPNTNDFELEGCKDIYAVGDGAGFTRSLSQAAANGLYVADKLLKK